MLKEIGFNQPQFVTPITPEGEAEKLYQALKICYEHYQEMIDEDTDEYPIEATVDYGVIIAESSSFRSHTLEITIPDQLDFNTMMLVAKGIINECDLWGWDDTDDVAWSVYVDDGYHYDRAVSTIKVKLEDWAS